MGKFIPNLSEISALMRRLLSKDIAWHWEGEQMKIFEKLKELVTEAPLLQYYNSKKDLVLTVDASSKGLGACILQENKPIAYGSRTLTDSQQNYAKIEKETLAITFECTKFHLYIFGHHVVVESDHKHLQSIFRKPLHSAPPRIQERFSTHSRC